MNRNVLYLREHMVVDKKTNNTQPDWVKDALDTKRRVSKYERDLLLNGPKNFSQALIYGQYKKRYDKMKGTYKGTPERPNLQSTFKDFNKRISINSG